MADVERWMGESISLLIDLPATHAVVESVMESPAFAQAFPLARSTSTIDSNAPDGLARMQLFTAILEPFATEVLRGIDPSQAIPDQRFSEIYDHLVRYVYNYEELDIKWIVHLSTIQSDVDMVKLSDHVQLRQSTLDDKQRAFRAFQDSSSTPLSKFYSREPRLPPRIDPHLIPNMVVEVKDHHRMPRNETDFSMAKEMAQRAVEALRLLRPDPISGHSMWLVDQNPFTMKPWYAHWFDGEPPLPQSKDSYVLSRSHALELPKIWEGLAAAPGGGLALARRRLADSYRRDVAIDRLLDYWIGLEALFLGRNDELKFRASMRIARYLGETSEARRALYELASKSYSLRSKVAHGMNLKPQDHNHEVIERTGDMLRRAIKQSVKAGSPPDGEALDLALLD